MDLRIWFDNTLSWNELRIWDFCFYFTEKGNNRITFYTIVKIKCGEQVADL